MKQSGEFSNEHVKHVSLTDSLEQKLAFLILNTEEPFVMLDTSLNIIAFNQQFEKLYLSHFGKHIVKNTSILNYAQKEKIKALKSIYSDVLKGQRKESEIEFLSPANTLQSFLIRYKPAYDEYNKIIGVFVSITDTREKKQAQQLLIASEKRYKAIIESSSDSVIILSEQGNPKYISPSFANVLGYNEKEAAETDLFSLIHPGDFQSVMNKLQEARQKPGISLKNYIARALHKDGTYRWMEADLKNLLNESAIEGIVINFRDITEKIEADQEKQFDHHNLYALINNTNDLMWSISKEGKLISSNRAFDDMVKLLSGGIVKKGENIPTEGFPEESLRRWDLYYARAFSGETFTLIEYTELPMEYWSETSFYPILKGKEIIGTACYSRNITERKLFERELEKNTSQLLLVKNKLEYSESRLHQAQSMAHIGNWEYNFAADVSVWSHECYRIYGLEPGEHKMSFLEWKSFIHPEDLEGFEKEMERARETLSNSSYQHRIICQDGTIKHVISESRFEFDENENPVGLYGVVRDITERINAEKELFQSHKLLQKLTNKVPVVVYQFKMDKKGRMSFPFMSKALEDILPGIDVEKLKEDPAELFRKIYSKDVKRVHESIEKSRRELSPWNYEFRTRGKHNKLLWIRGSSRPEKAENGNIVWYGYIEDVTEKKLADEQIRFAKERYDFVAKATNDAIYDWDLLTHQTLRTGDGLKTLFGYDPEKIIHEKNFWLDRVHPDDIEVAYGKLQGLLLDPDANYCNEEYRFLKADNTYAYVYDKGFIIRDSNGKAIRLIGATQDITKRKEAEFQLKELNERLEKRAKELAISNAELEQFAYIASHDLQEPLRMVTSFLTQLENKYKAQLDDKAKQYIHFATDGAVRMRRLILDLLEFSRVGRQTNTKEQVDINDLLSEAVKLNRVVIDEKKALIEWKDLPVLTGSKTGLLQVFQNLISNALKYQEPGSSPVISVTGTETRTHWQFAISDNGIGIEERYFEKIFIVFQRLHNKDEFSGTGIGLAICKKIVESHQGHIWVESKYGSGSIFHFTIAKPD